MAILCRTTSVPALGPEASERSHAYSGKRPNSLSVVRALEMRTASAAMGGTVPLFRSVAAEILVSSQAGRMRESSLVAKLEIEGDLVCTYARI